MKKRGPTKVDAYIGKRVSLRRRAMGVSQTELGRALGVSFQQVQKYEKGTNRLSGDRLQLLAGVLQVPVSFFFEGAPVKSVALPGAADPDFVEEFLQDKRGVELARCFVRMPVAQRSAVLALARALTAT